jgi:tRNA U34 2-thiouridine synthase MnmA/TrmU
MKVIALLSGGLDSRLAVRVMTHLGFEVLALHFYTPFSSKELSVVEETVKNVAQSLGATGCVIALGEEYLAMIKNPDNGYGGNLNPCIDCKILMFSRAKALLAEYGAQFLVTGEVLGQRPMSQYKDAMRRIEKASGTQGLVVRPLSGKILDATIPEQNGWVDRSEMYDINGRARTRQFELARELNVVDYPWPGGGCLLTETSFCRKLKDIIVHDELNSFTVELLKSGRHLRLPSGRLATLGKNDAHNTKLLRIMRKTDIIIGPRDEGGPYCLLDKTADDGDITLAAGIVARYTRKDAKIVIFVRKNGDEKLINATALGEVETERMLL